MPMAAACMRLSESIMKVPEMTMRSPFMRPRVISTSPPRLQPVSMRRGSNTPLPLSTNTILRMPVSTTASTGTVNVGG